jgi:hypothetical protein
VTPHIVERRTVATLSGCFAVLKGMLSIFLDPNSSLKADTESMDGWGIFVLNHFEKT